MNNKAADNSTTNSSERKKVKSAKRRFFVGMFDMGWRLTLVLVLPIIAGAWLDKNKDSGYFVLIGLALGVVGSVYVIKNIVDDYSKEVEISE